MDYLSGSPLYQKNNSGSQVGRSGRKVQSFWCSRWEMSIPGSTSKDLFWHQRSEEIPFQPKDDFWTPMVYWRPLQGWKNTAHHHPKCLARVAIA